MENKVSVCALPSCMDDIISFIEKEEVNFVTQGCGGTIYNGEGFGLNSVDYIKFAKNNLVLNTVDSKLNVISNLKRALDCQIDTYFLNMGMHSYLKKKNIKISRKLELLAAIGFYNPLSLDRLNKLRNKIEHHYHEPLEEDLEIYFDLVSAFCQILELAMWEIDSCSYSYGENKIFFTVYDKDKIQVTFGFLDGGSCHELNFNIKDNNEDFAMALNHHRTLTTKSFSRY